MAKLAIGKASVYYTLWNVTSGDSCTTYTYIKNISMNFDEAVRLYPDAEYHDWLRGTSSVVIESAPKEEHVPGVFYFGKYAGRSVEDVPVGYLAWFYNLGGAYDESWYEATRGLIVRTLTDAGYILLTADGITRAFEPSHIMHGTGLEYDEDGAIIVRPSQNPGDCGLLFSNFVTVEFPEVKEMFYRGYPYYLPVLRGKAKKIKNKTVRITDADVTEVPVEFRDGYAWLNCFHVTVKDFEVV